MTEILHQYDKIPESESNTDGVYDITTIKEAEETKFESLNPDRLFQMSQELVSGGAIDCLLERLAAVKTETEVELAKIRAMMRPLAKIQTQYATEINGIVARISVASTAVSVAGKAGGEIAELATKLIAANEQLADISSEIDTYKSDEAKHTTRIEQCESSIDEVMRYRESCIADLDIAKQLNASMRSKPGLGMLVPESLLLSPDQRPSNDNYYSRLLGEAAGKIVEYQLPESIADYSPPEVEKAAAPPKREQLSPAPLNITNSPRRLPRFLR